jgi:hypothetical protein
LFPHASLNTLVIPQFSLTHANHATLYALREHIDCCRNEFMAVKKDPVEIALKGTLLGSEGREVKKGLWENSVYLADDGFVYHITAYQGRGGIVTKIAGKRAVGEYLRWVDGLFRPGELPGEANAVHYRAARKLRELI